MQRAHSAADIYDRIGDGYASRRRPDARWISHIDQAVGDRASLINVGAGTGSYEPAAMAVVGVEPSRTMIGQRPPSAAPVVCGVAEQLPFADAAFEVGLAVLTVHHWSDAAAGLAELRRVSHRQVVVTWDPVVTSGFWLVRDYLPEIVARERDLATLATVLAHLGPATVDCLPVPADCGDGVLGAYWRRPEAYLDPTVRGAISGLALLDSVVVSTALERLASDLADGRWHARHSALIERDELDLGYRLVIAGH